MKRALILLALIPLIFCCTKNAAAADRNFDFAQFRLLPILDQGRVKPLDSFARALARDLWSSERVAGLSADEFLAETLFDPAAAIERPALLLQDTELKNLLALPQQQKYFSAAELQRALAGATDQIKALGETEDLTPQQNALLQLHDRVFAYTELLRSLTLVLPLAIDLPESYKGGPAGEHPVYRQLTRVQPQITADLRRVIQQKGENPEDYNDDEKKLALLAFSLQQIAQGGEGNDALRVIPPTAEKSELWLSPWSAPAGTPALALWQDMATAYQRGEAQQFSAASAAALDFAKDKINLNRFRLEHLYNLLKPFHLALALYSLSLLCALAALALPALPKLQLAATGLLSLGAFVHLAGLATRIALLQRPPVGTLYESVLFVSLICAGAALLLAHRKHNFTAIPAGALASALLLAVAPVTLPQGESMEMLTAVLNTNFWLATHVLCITAGYAACILCGCLAQFWFAANIAGADQTKRRMLQQKTYHLSLVALLLTAVGTVLGGIWADQSWGRFWGWDPKENGALLIVLWLIWLHHGRHAGHLNTNAFMAALAFVNVVVALAWFGVNLLSTGLHSYGFTSGMAIGLAAFCAVQTLLIAALWRFSINKEKNHAS